MKTFTSLFSGFGLADQGLESAGLTHLNAFEYDPRIAEVGQANTKGRYHVADVCSVDWTLFERPDALWMSPVCKRASQANVGAEEAPEDIATAEACVRAIKAWTPKLVFLENVWGYRHFGSFALICDALKECGYSYNFWRLNSADYGVAQTRQRLILVAVRERGVRGAMVPIRKPVPTHIEPSKILRGGLFDMQSDSRPWRGWYEAIEDLIPDLPDSEFAPWQLERLPKELQNCLVDVRNYDLSGDRHRLAESPSQTVTTDSGHVPKAFLLGDQHRQFALDGEPAMTVRAGENGGGVPKAFLLSSMNTTRDATVCYSETPVMTIVGAFGLRPSNMISAFIVSNAKTDFGDGIREGEEPMMSVTGQHNGRSRAFIVDGQACDNGQTLTIRDEAEPFFTATATATRRPARAWLDQGRVVKMTPRALARFQSLPDSYQLSGNTALDCTGIGNGVPSLLVEVIGRTYAHWLD
jgi:DNA (cytosine-5)-methyltransferase 1